MSGGPRSRRSASRDAAEDFGTLAELVGDAAAAAMLRDRIEAIPPERLQPAEARTLAGLVDGGAIRAPNARAAALAREVLAAEGIEAEVIERPDDRPIPPSPPAKNPAPERPRKRRKRRRRSRGRAGDAAAGPGQPRQPAPRSEAPEQSAEQRADLIAAERPREVADAIRASAEVLAAKLPDDPRAAAFRWLARKPRPEPEPGTLLLRGGEARPWTQADAEAADRALVDLAREVGVLVAGVDRLPRTTPDRAMLATVAGKLSRQPALDTALLPAIEVAAVAVDGVPVASPTMRPRRVYRPREPEQTSLLPGPRTLAGRPFDPLLYASDGIEHPTTRADVLHLARAAFALVRPMTADLAAWARLLTGKRGRLDPRRDLARATDALAVLYGLGVRLSPSDWRPVAFVDVPAPEVWTVGPPSWSARGGAWRLTGGLFRPGLRSARDTFARRALDGIESGLAWSPPRQRQRTPALLLPASGRTGPGPEVRIPGRDVLRLAGREVGEGPLSDADRKRLSRLAEHLAEAGYQAPARGEAPAGDAVELVGRERSKGSREAALIVRASARMVEATRKAEAREPGAFAFVPARRLLPDRGGD